MTQIQDTYDEKFAELAKLLSGFIDSGKECGASICVNLDGKDVVDIWAGYSDE